MKPVGTIFSFGRKTLPELSKGAAQLGIKEIWTTAGLNTQSGSFLNQVVINTAGSPMYLISANFLGSMVYTGSWSANRNSSGNLSVTFNRNVMGTNFTAYRTRSQTCTPSCSTGRFTMNQSVTDEIDGSVSNGNWSISNSIGTPSGSWCGGANPFLFRSAFTLVVYQGTVQTFTRSIQGVNHTPQKIF